MTAPAMAERIGQARPAGQQRRVKAPTARKPPGRVRRAGAGAQERLRFRSTTSSSARGASAAASSTRSLKVLPLRVASAPFHWGELELGGPVVVCRFVEGRLGSFPAATTGGGDRLAVVEQVRQRQDDARGVHEVVDAPGAARARSPRRPAVRR